MKQKTKQQDAHTDAMARDTKALGGSDFDDFNTVLGHQTLRTVWLGYRDDESKELVQRAAVQGVAGIAPRDELEGMLAAQMLACHNASMECHRRAMMLEQTTDGRNYNLTQANRLSRTFAALLEVLNRHRGKGQQKVTVEHVHVHEGGQAIVGNVEQGGGSDNKSKEQPHAKAISDARQPAMRRKNKKREPVPSTRNGKR